MLLDLPRQDEHPVADMPRLMARAGDSLQRVPHLARSEEEPAIAIQLGRLDRLRIRRALLKNGTRL